MTMTKMCFFLQEITAQLTAFKSLKVDHLKQAVTLGHFGDLITFKFPHPCDEITFDGPSDVLIKLQWNMDI